MSKANETIRASSAEQKTTLKSNIAEEINKLVQLKLITEELAGLKIDPNSVFFTENLNNALKALTVRQYLSLNSKNDDYLLGLSDCKSYQLTVAEKQFVKEQLFKNLRKTLEPIIECGERLEKEVPDLFTPKNLETAYESPEKPSNDPVLADLLELEVKYRNSLQKMIETRNQKCALLKRAAELRVGDSQILELEKMLAESELNQTKAEVLGGFMSRELFARSEKSLNAYKQIESFMNEKEQL